MAARGPSSAARISHVIVMISVRNGSVSAPRSEAWVTAADKTGRKIGFSIKALEMAEEKEAVAQYGSSDSGASLGDILGAALNKAKGEEGEEGAKPKRKRAAKDDAEGDASTDE